jgi:hypothetical protein
MTQTSGTSILNCAMGTRRGSVTAQPSSRSCSSSCRASARLREFLGILVCPSVKANSFHNLDLTMLIFLIMQLILAHTCSAALLLCCAHSNHHRPCLFSTTASLVLAHMSDCYFRIDHTNHCCTRLGSYQLLNHCCVRLVLAHI